MEQEGGNPSEEPRLSSFLESASNKMQGEAPASFFFRGFWEVRYFRHLRERGGFRVLWLFGQ